MNGKIIFDEHNNFTGIYLIIQSFNKLIVFFTFFAFKNCNSCIAEIRWARKTNKTLWSEYINSCGEHKFNSYRYVQRNKAHCVRSDKNRYSNHSNLQMFRKICQKRSGPRSAWTRENDWCFYLICIYVITNVVPWNGWMDEKKVKTKAFLVHALTNTWMSFLLLSSVCISYGIERVPEQCWRVCTAESNENRAEILFNVNIVHVLNMMLLSWIHKRLI